MAPTKKPTKRKATKKKKTENDENVSDQPIDENVDEVEKEPTPSTPSKPIVDVALTKSILKQRPSTIKKSVQLRESLNENFDVSYLPEDYFSKKIIFDQRSDLDDDDDDAPTNSASSLQNDGEDDNSDGDDDINDAPIAPFEEYDPLKGKIQASMSWLIAKVFGSNMPNGLRDVFSIEDDEIALKPLVVQCLVSGELYCRAAINLFDGSMSVFQNHGKVLQALHGCKINVVDGDTGVSITDAMLQQVAPFNLNAHLAMIDGLMTAHMREVISLERVVESVKKYTNVHRNEQPVDIEDAILFWINKICATVQQNNQEALLIPPEMDDLYEDICDGTCAATVVHFYHPNNLPFHEIRYKDPMSIKDKAHNLRLVQRFCQHNFTWSIFHFSVEDILHMPESLKPNVNAFFAELFYLLEVHQDVKSSARTQQAKTKRGLPEKVAEIPNLRSGSSGSAASSRDRNSSSKPTTKSAVPSAATLNLRRDTPAMNSLATSRLASTDSLATKRSKDSLRYRPYVGSNTESPLTGAGSSPSSARNFPPIQLTPTQNAENNGQYQRSDSMPVRPGAPSAAIRLQLEQKRRQYVYEVEKIVDKRTVGTDVQYLVSWTGYPGEDSWVSSKNCKKCKEAIDDYERGLLKPSSEASSSAASSKRKRSPTPNSQVMGGKGLSGASSSLVPSGSADNLDQLNTKSQSSDGTGGSGPHATTSSVVPAEPTHRLTSQETNRILVVNAIQYCVLAGVVNEPTKQKVLTELAKSDSKHFLLLFRDKKCQFKSLYSWDQVSDTAHKLFGLGPTTCQENFMDLVFKYDSGGNQFNQISTKPKSGSVVIQIDGFTVKEEYWQKK